ncbi:hypothetical protein [Desulfobacula toluolica]|uniref:hypothetical protein n=1 Tax=Desulfobacula toluolica TaxID=28223 RepID=UPI0002F82A71|nr:hypothetical protein [Desulfobacula toluolica]
MLGPGPLIAIDVVLLYTILGPLVLFAIYVLFDSLDRSGKPVRQSQDAITGKKDPAVWTNDDIDLYMDRI